MSDPTCGDCGNDDADFRECCLKYLCDDCAGRAGCDAARTAAEPEKR